MNPFLEMLRRTTSSPLHDQMMRFVEPLNDHFGINHFWFYRVTDSGLYTYLGTNAAWNEYAYENRLIDHFPCLRHPDTLLGGINLMKKTSSNAYKNVLRTAWENFRINFSFQILQKTSDAVEGFGFATHYHQQAADERLLNELPLLRHFIKIFQQRHQRLFRFLDENSVDLGSYLGPVFNKNSKMLQIPRQRDVFLRKIGCEAIYSLTEREKDVLKFIANGYPAPYIAQQLFLRRRTVENYLGTIKGKLSCNSKIELIQKAQELVTMGLLDSL